MPTDASTVRFSSTETQHMVALQPVSNQLYSLMLLYKQDKMPGVADWVAKTRESLTLEQLQRNRLVMNGLCYSFSTEADLPSFGAYLDHLESLAPASYQDRILAMYLSSSPGSCTMRDADPPFPAQRGRILGSVDSYLSFVSEHFEPPCVDVELEAQAYRYVVDPPSLKSLVIGHLREMWEAHLAAEWARVRPMLTNSVEAFQRSDLARMDRREAVRFVIGKDIPDAGWEEEIDSAEAVILAPNAHLGPYLGRCRIGRNLVILFGARLPEGSQAEAPDLSRSEILTRLDALSDDHRLHILRLAADAEELRATDVMTALDISQSAASRSLTQLTATGYLVEKRREGGKYYRLNPEKVQDTVAAILRFLGVPSAVPPLTGTGRKASHE
jgi:DNA-binding transcriptional ArsR family regulator